MVKRSKRTTVLQSAIGPTSKSYSEGNLQALLRGIRLGAFHPKEHKESFSGPLCWDALAAAEIANVAMLGLGGVLTSESSEV